MLLLCSLAFADDLSLTYAISLQGAEIGEREVTVRSLGEQRLLEVWTEFTVPVVGIHFEQRASGMGGSGAKAFAAVNLQDSLASEVQLAPTPEGWTVTRVLPSGVNTKDYPVEGIELTSLSLLDPGVRLREDEELRVLSAETGEILTGTLRPAGPVELRIGGQTVPCEAWTWSTVEGDLELVYAADGVLVRSTTRIAGLQVQLQLQELPDWGSAMEQPFIVGPVVKEEEL